MAAKLTAKQQRFVEEYLIDLNATQAAIRAGYSPKSAEEQGYQLLHKTSVSDAVSKAKAARSRRTGINADRVLREYARLGFLDPRKLFDEEGGPKNVAELDEDTAAALVGFEVTELFEGRGEEKILVGYLKKYKLADKKGALDSIAKHLGMFTEKVELSGQVNNPFAGLTTDELRKLIDDG